MKEAFNSMEGVHAKSYTLDFIGKKNNNNNTWNEYFCEINLILRINSTGGLSFFSENVKRKSIFCSLLQARV